MIIEPENRKSSVSIQDLIEHAPAELEITVVTGRDLLSGRTLTSERIQKLGLALTGFTEYLHAGRIHIIGKSEISFLNGLKPDERVTALGNISPETTSCILVTADLEPTPELLNYSSQNGVPVLRTPLVSSRAISLVTNFLQSELAPHITIHGVLLGMFSIGVLITGESGIGKSECALDLVSRGHLLIADDAVTLRHVGGRIEGESPEMTRELLEIHGLGIINVRDLFGISAVGSRLRLELCVQLEQWNASEAVERLGLETLQTQILGLSLPTFRLPVSPGRNIATLVETAVRIYLLKRSGVDAVRDLIQKHTDILASNA